MFILYIYLFIYFNLSIHYLFIHYLFTRSFRLQWILEVAANISPTMINWATHKDKDLSSWMHVSINGFKPSSVRTMHIPRSFCIYILGSLTIGIPRKEYYLNDKQTMTSPYTGSTPRLIHDRMPQRKVRRHPDLKI